VAPEPTYLLAGLAFEIIDSLLSAPRVQVLTDRILHL
jgi:hypothetical protein